MADYGAAVSQKGYDVKTCDDRFLVYSSAFQTLKVFSVSSVSTTIPSSGTNTITITHNLGYYAPYLVVYNGSTTRGVATSYYGEMDGDNYYPLTCQMSTTTLKIIVDDAFDTLTSSAGDTVYFTAYVFLDNFDTMSESIINTGTSSGASSTDYGIRISKPGYDVKTCDDINCIMSSSYYSHIVDKKGIKDLDSTATVSHGLGYYPVSLGYLKASGTSYLQKITLEISTNQINYIVGSGDDLYYIILKNKNG